MNPRELRYTREHEWVHRAADGTALVGITDYAQEQLGDIVFLNLPEVGTELRQLEKMGEVETVKAVSDLFSPVSGTVAEVNQRALENPQLVNQEPYALGWLLRVTPQDPSELERLLTAEEYEAMLAQKA